MAMKKYISTLLLILIFSSCIDHRYDEMVDDTAYFPNSELVVYQLTVTNDNDYVYDLWVHKGGFFQKKFVGRVELSYAYLVEYNQTNNTDYEMLDSRYYTLQRDFTMEEGENECAIPITFKVKQMLDDFGYQTFYLPLSVQSLTPEGGIYDEKSSVLLAFTLKQPLVTIDTDWKEKQYKKFDNESSYEFDITAVMDVDAPEDFQVIYTRDESLLEPGELALDPQYYTFSDSVLMAKGEKYAENYMQLNVAEMPDGEWVIPIKLSSSNEKIGMLDDAWLALTVSKGELNEVTWSATYLQGDKIIIPGSAETALEIGEIDQITATATADESWLRPHITSNKIVIETDENNTGAERSATLTIRNQDNNLPKTIEVIQADVLAGIPLNKEIWTLEAYSDNCTKHLNDIPKMYDGQWRKSANDKDSYVELNDRDPADPFVLTFNLGMEQSLNTFGIMPRQQWLRPSPKRVKIEVSPDNENWTTVGKGQDANGILVGFGDAETDSSKYPELLYNGVIKWFDFEEPVRARYIRLSLYESWWNSGNVVCIEEVFASFK